MECRRGFPPQLCYRQPTALAESMQAGRNAGYWVQTGPPPQRRLGWRARRSLLHSNAMPENTPKPLVFVVMPFGSEFNDVYEVGIKAVCEDVGASEKTLHFFQQDFSGS